MELFENILDAIGNSPVVRLNRVTRQLKQGELFAKCEFTNPGGSIKDRIGRWLVEQAEKRGDLKPGGIIVEGTSGNTGMGLAITAAIKGYKSIFVMPDKMSEEKRANLRAFGAKVIITPTAVAADSPESYYSVARKLGEEPNSFYVNQYDNLDNRECHYHTTGPEIWRQTEGKLDAIVIGMGTCGTISGIGKFLKEKNPNIKVIGVDPKGSILKDLHDSGKMVEAKGYLIEGIGEDIVPKNLDMSVIDEIIRIEDKESFLMTRTLLIKEGIYAGVSSGAAVVGALRYMSRTENPGRVLVILPDSGNRYLSKAYNDEWMIENSFMERKSDFVVSDLISTLNKSDRIIHGAPTDTVDAVIELMRKEGVSQLPVFKSGEICGVISEADLLRPLISGAVQASDPIEGLLDQNYSLIEVVEPIERLNEVFTSGKICLVTEQGRAKYVVTKIDLISFLSHRTGSKDV